MGDRLLAGVVVGVLGIAPDSVKVEERGEVGRMGLVGPCRE